MQLLIAVVVGAILGVVGARFLFVGSWLSLLPWSVAGIALGYWARRPRWVLVGGSYGFALFFAFMVAGYSGAESMSSRIPFFWAIGMAGAAYGMVVGWMGKWLWLWRTRDARRQEAARHPH